MAAGLFAVSGDEHALSEANTSAGLNMALAAGRLRHRVDIQQRAEAQDPDTGDIVYDWTPFAASVPAAIEPLSARELVAAAAVQSKVTTRILIRGRAGITAKMRIIHKSAVYNIEGDIPDADSGLEYLTLPCSRGANLG